MPGTNETILLEIDIESEKKHLLMMDGSCWFVNPGDLPIVATWIPTETILIEKTDDDVIFLYKLSNMSTDNSVRAMKVS